MTLTPRLGLVLSAAALLGGCLQQDPPLPDTLYFAPGTPIQYQGQSAKLYGNEACAQGQLAGHSCLIFPPNRPTGTAVIVMGQQVQELAVTAKRDPDNPMLFVIEDESGHRLVTTNAYEQGQGNFDIVY